MQLRYELPNRQRIALLYETRIQPPTLENLQNTLDNTNAMQMTIGNPDLKEAYGHFIILNGTFGMDYLGRISVRSNFTFINNYNGKQTIFALNDTTVMKGIILRRGAQLTIPVNLNKQLNLSLLIDQSRPVDFINSELYWALRYRTLKIPNEYNNTIFYTFNTSQGIEVSFRDNRNLSFEYVLIFDYRYIKSSAENRSFGNYSYSDFLTEMYFRYRIWEGISLHTDAKYQYTSKGSANEDRNNIIMNLNLSKKLFNNTAELSFTVYDLFNNRKEIQKNINELYVEERQSQLPMRCYMLTFSYNLRDFN